MQAYLLPVNAPKAKTRGKQTLSLQFSLTNEYRLYTKTEIARLKLKRSLAVATALRRPDKDDRLQVDHLRVTNRRTDHDT